MNTEEQVDRVLESWLAEGPTQLSDRSIAAIVDQLDDTKPRGPFWFPGRFQMPRVASALGAAAVVVVAAALALNVVLNQQRLGVGPSPTAPDSRLPFVGDWIVSESPADLGRDTMNVSLSTNGTVAIVIHDSKAFYALLPNDTGSFISVCSGGSTITGAGQVQGGSLAFSAPVLTCDDGAKPIQGQPSWTPLEEVLRSLRFTHDSASDELIDTAGGHWLREGAEPRPTATPISASDPEVIATLNDFLDARVAGEGAQQYLSVRQDEIPLVYATTSGSRYDRGEFKPVNGYDWPYGNVAFKVRLFAGDTVVEQLFFANADDPSRLSYEPHGFAIDIAPTTEDGQPVALLYSYFNGEVSLRAASPWVFLDPNPYPNPSGRLIPEGPGVQPTTDGGQRVDWDEFYVIADPVLVATDCQPAPDPADAQGLAASIGSYPGIEATEPFATSVGGAEALMMDVVVSAGTTISAPADDLGNFCARGLLSVLFDTGVGSSESFNNGVVTGRASGDRMRLYLINAPTGSSMRVIGIVIVAPESTFQRAVDAAAPVVDSIEFHTP